MLRSLTVGAALVLCAAAASASSWNIDADHTNVGFVVRHMMVSDVRGTFDGYTGTIEVDDKDVTKSKVSIDIDTKSVNTRNVKRDEHLRSADFFDAEKFPKISFKSTKIEKAAADHLKVTGDLTLHGVTKPVVLDVDPISAELKDPWGGTHRGTKAVAKINRKDFGLTWNKALESGGVIVGEDVAIEIQLELLKAEAAKK